MSIIKKASVAANEQDAREIVQPNITAGYETCQDIPTIKEELDRLSIEMDKYSQLASKEAHNGKSIEYYRKSERARIRYWAIRWTMGWEKEIPNV